MSKDSRCNARHIKQRRVVIVTPILSPAQTKNLILGEEFQRSTKKFHRWIVLIVQPLVEFMLAEEITA